MYIKIEKFAGITVDCNDMIVFASPAFGTLK